MPDPRANLIDAMPKNPMGALANGWNTLKAMASEPTTVSPPVETRVDPLS